MGKRFWLVLAVVVIALVGIFALTNHGNNTQPSVTPTPNPQTIMETDHVRGPTGAKVTLVEYGDFQCPACGTAYPLVKQLEAAFPTDLRVVFRHFPLTNIHPQAFSGARAAEAAGAQGKFFEMHDLLYEHQPDWTQSSNAPQIFRDYARQIGIDVNKFNDDYNAGATSDRINADIKSGQDAGIDATPGFFLNGQKLEQNPRTFEEFKAKIQALL